MSHQMFDMQAALLYDAAPQLNPVGLRLRLIQQAAIHGLTGVFEILPGLTNDTEIALSGCGVHIMISRNAQPLPFENFQLQLSAPINQLKAVDFESIIKSHAQAIVINVGDGETPMPVEARKTMEDMGIGAAVDPVVKATVLHLVIQAYAESHPPLMTDFLPSQSLLSPMELEAVADLGLPIPILFHPFPTVDDADALEQARIGMIALHSENLIGKQITLEAVPDGVDTALTINLLASLIKEHRDGNLPLEHGDVLQETSEDVALYIRHAAPEAPDGPDRIIVSFDTPASGPAPERPTPAPEPDPSPQPQPAFQTDPEVAADQIAFHERVARLKAKAQPSPTAQAGYATALPDTSGADMANATQPTRARRKLPAGSLKIGIPVLIAIGLYVFNPAQMLERQITAQIAAQPNIEQMFGEGALEAMGQPGDTATMNTVTLAPGSPSSGAVFEAQIKAMRDAAKTAPATTTEAKPQRPVHVTRIETPKGSNGQFIMSGRDANGNQVVFSREIKDEADRQDIVQGIVQGTLRSELINPSQ